MERDSLQASLNSANSNCSGLLRQLDASVSEGDTLKAKLQELQATIDVFTQQNRNDSIRNQSNQSESLNQDGNVMGASHNDTIVSLTQQLATASEALSDCERKHAINLQALTTSFQVICTDFFLGI
jgi:hypothetical protein